MPRGANSKLKFTGRTPPGRRLRRLRRAELPVDTVELARYFIGKVVVHDTDSGRLSGRIVETEAYPVGDAAGHAFRGKTKRNQTLFLERGHAYVYLNYGISFLLNVTSEIAGVGAGVLLRAIEPLEGIEMMSRSRGTTRLADIGRGPGRLTRALQVDLAQDGLDLCAAGPLWLAATAPETGAQRTSTIGKSIRIGITRDADRVLRFYEPGNAHVSGVKKMRQ
jgi:DNA-3-methyladenine glycosylase